MGGKGPEVLVTLTTDFGKVLDGIHRTKIRGGTHLATGIQIAGVRPGKDPEHVSERLTQSASLPSNIVKISHNGNALLFSPARRYKRTRKA